MSKNIDQITRTLTEIDGTERLAARDSSGDFKITVDDLLNLSETYTNYIYNPDGNIDQDGFSGSVPVNGEYTLDMWKTTLTSGGNEPVFTVSRNISELEKDDKSESCLHVNVSNAGTPTAGIETILYSSNPKFNNKYREEDFTASFRAKIENGASIQLSIADGVARTVNTIVGDGTWQTYTVKKTLAPAATVLTFEIILALGATSLVTVGDYYFKQMRLYRGSKYEAYQPRGYDGDLELCLSVYEKSYAYGVPPATITDVGRIYNTSFDTTSLYYSTLEFIKTKVTAPTITIYNPTGGTANAAYDETGAAEVTGVIAYNISTQRANISGATNFTANHIHKYHYVADSRP